MKILCPHCGRLLRQAANHDGPNYCPGCRQLFDLPPPAPVPAWILGAVLFLAANLHLVWQRVML